MNKAIFLLIAIVVFVSGCSIPGLPGFGGSVQSQYENDVVIIKDQSVFPQSVKASQQITLVTYVQNLGETNPDKEFRVNVDLYDTCGVFKEIKTTCAGTTEGGKCKDLKLLPKEVKEITWKLTPDPDKVKVPIPSCKLKVAVSYPYKTTSQTEIYLINPQEAQLQREQGTFRERTSSIQKSEGPVFAYVEPDKSVRQPYSTENKALPVSLYVENKGSGFISGNLNGGQLTTKIDSKAFTPDKTTCSWEEDDFKNKITLINKKSPPYACQIPTGTFSAESLTREKTSIISVEFGQPYTYEFRKESQVSIEPMNYQKPAG